jgi:hypothetical protein
MPLKYNPKGAFSPKLAKLMSALARLCQDSGMMASLAITDGTTGEFFIPLDAEWSCVKMDKLPGGDIQVRIKSKREDYPSAAAQKAHIEKTVNGLGLLFKMVDHHRESLAAVMADLQKAINFTHYGEEFKGHTADPPDPEKKPETLAEAAELIYATLDHDQLMWVKNTSLYDAMPNLHHSFGQQLRNAWGLWEPDNPLQKFVREEWQLFGHADDLSTLIFTQLWGRVRGEPEEVTLASLNLEVEGMKQHWRQAGINPETGEKGIIV